MIKTLLGAAALVAATAAVVPAASACERVVARSDGFDNVAEYAASRCGRIHGYQRGDRNVLRADVDGHSAAVVGQRGDDIDADVVLRGDGNVLGADLTDGARFSGRMIGHDQELAVYGGGRVDVGMEGVGNVVVVETDDR